MKVMGLRVSASEIRYAILENNNNQVLFLNRNTENRLIYPANINTIELKLKWCRDELNRIIRQNPGIDKISLKTNEFTRSETSAKRETIYIDAIILLVAAENNIPITRKLYSQIGASSRDVKEQAETCVGKTDKYWNNTIADAIVSAHWEIRGL